MSVCFMCSMFCGLVYFFFFKQKTAYEMRISDWSSDVCSSDLARFGTNNERRRYVFGYKLHVAVDAGSGLVRALVTTPANVQEVALAGDLIQGDELAVYGDRGYDADWLHRELAGRGIADGIMRRNRPKHRLSADEAARTHAPPRRRRAAEKRFCTLQRTSHLRPRPVFHPPRTAPALPLARSDGRRSGKEGVSAGKPQRGP